MVNKYNNLYFWEKVFLDQTQSEIFNTKITTETIFFYGVISDSQGRPEKRWLHFPNLYSLLGFLHYGFIPQAFFQLHSSGYQQEWNSRYSLEEIIDWIMLNGQSYPKINIVAMYRIEKYLDELWQYPIEGLRKRLDWLQRFYDGYFNRKIDQYTYFKLYDTPIELGQYIVDGYLEDQQLTIGQVEEKLGMDKNQWLAICRDVYKQPFLSQRFTQLINNRL